MSNNKSIALALMHQYAMQGRNLLSVCRLAVKSLIDKSCLEVIDESSVELQNFCVIVEHILCHRLKPQQKWYGTNVCSFWEYVRVACSDVTHNCLNNIKTLEKPRTSQGKGRAWLRMALMEKRLSEYLSAALQHSRLTRAFYSDGSIMLTEEIHVLTGVLLGLNAIDFSFDIRSEDLDQPFIPVIDFTPYLKFVQTPEREREDVDLQELSEMSTSVVSDVFGDDDPTDTWPNRLSRLDSKYRLVVEQKGYLEELVRLRESQITEMHCQKKKLIEAMQHYENESRKDRQQLESVIIELQAQISQMKTDKRTQRERYENVVVQYQSDPPSASVHSEGDVCLTAQLEAQRASSKDSVKHPPSHLEAGDSKSIMSSTSTGSAMNVPRRNDDSHSMVPLAGSFTSETSVKTGDTLAHSSVVPTAPGKEDEKSSKLIPKREGNSNEDGIDETSALTDHLSEKECRDDTTSSSEIEVTTSPFTLNKNLDLETQEGDEMDKSN